ncbi:response regulator [Variovorax sp. VNK109]|uniref:response regulator n=1 Tax=Variovorax sp. VNK109 TaxID=3400919 RepID=UPI003C0E3513
MSPECPETSPQPSRRVMVVDDTEVSRMLARAYLELAGFIVSEHESAADALTQLRANPDDSGLPAAMLIDIEMPVMGGEELARRVREEFGAALRLIGYTAHCRDEELRRIKDAGFDQVVMKPGSVEQMALAIGAANA